MRGYHKALFLTSPGACPAVEDYLKPDLFIWDMQEEFPEISDGKCPEEDCEEGLLFFPLTHSYMMRMLYDFEQQLLLVTSMLRCKSKVEHRFLGYDPRIITQLADPEKLPFVLFHKVGLTRELFNSIMSQVSNGVKFGQIQNSLRKSYAQSYLERQEAYNNAVSQNRDINVENVQQPKAFPAIKVKGPRDTFIGHCFLLGFKEKDFFYKLSMSQILADEWIKLDSSFKLPSNVGTNAKGVWKKEVDHLFHCQNEVGQIMTWKLTGQGTFEEIRDMIVSIKDRHYKTRKRLKGCCTDLCCEWRDELLSIFGPGFQVKHDIDVSLCKFAEKIQEECPFFAPCLEEFRLVFQDPVDTNKVRILHTPLPNVIAGSLDTFKDKWKRVKDENGKNILNSIALRFLIEMEAHIMNGCFSGIPPFTNGVGRKEFEEMLKKRLNRNKIGVPMIIGIVSIALHEHNTLRQTEVGRDTAPVLLIVPNEQKESNDSSFSLSIGDGNLQCLSIESNMNKTLELIACNQAKVIKSKEETNARNLMMLVEEYFKKIPDDHNYKTKNQDIHESIINTALMYLRYHECQLKFAPENYVNGNLVPFLTCAFPLLMQDEAIEEAELKKNFINQVLSRFNGLEAIWFFDTNSVIPERLNLEEKFFCAVALILESYLEKSSDKHGLDVLSIQNSLFKQGFKIGMTAVDIISNLKRLIKSKGGDINQQNKDASDALKCLSNTAAAAGDAASILKTDSQIDADFELLVRDIANTLSTHIIIITELTKFPVIPIFPQQSQISSPNLFIFCKGQNFVPLFQKGLVSEKSAVSQSDAGTRDSTKRLGPNSKTLRSYCLCGKRAAGREEGKCYMPFMAKYTTRCPCFRTKEPCTNKCDCKNCKNPFGCKEIKMTGESGGIHPFKRRRHTHRYSSLSRDVIVDRFQEGAGLEMGLENWSLADKFVFEALMGHLKTEEESLTTELLAQNFNSVVQVASNIAGLKDLVGLKTPAQVNERLKEREKDVELYLQMYQTQLDLLMNKQELLMAVEEPGNDDADMSVIVCLTDNVEKV